MNVGSSTSKSLFCWIIFVWFTIKHPDTVAMFATEVSWVKPSCKATKWAIWRYDMQMTFTDMFMRITFLSWKQCQIVFYYFSNCILLFQRKNFECEHCDKQFRYKQGLQEHQTRVHASGSKHDCDRCDKSYPNKTELNRHKLACGQKPFSCMICKRTYGYKANLTRHMKTHK